MLDDAGALAPDFTDEVLAKSCVTRTADTTVKADA
jgi:NAD(P) transhydrogenase subunit alpha